MDKVGKHHVFLTNQHGFMSGWKSSFRYECNGVIITRLVVIGIIPVLYIAATTMISRGEVHGGSKSILYFARILYVIVRYLKSPCLIILEMF